MKVLLDHGGWLHGWLCGKYFGRVQAFRNAVTWRSVSPLVSFALDNGVYGAFTSGDPWNEAAFYERLGWLRSMHMTPEWVVVPDSVGNSKETLRLWSVHAPRIEFRKAIAVQDGMTPADVPPDADIVFVGGTYDWKWRHLRTWTGNFDRVHVGRVNTYRHLWIAHESGAESCDGTGWFRGNECQLGGLLRYLDESDRGIRPEDAQPLLPLGG